MINNSLNANNTGIQSLTSGGVLQGVTITGTTNQISVSNGDGTGGNPTLSLTSNIYVTGISFNSGTNIISAYSEGTWTPGISAVTTAPTVTYTTQVGRYTKIAHCVFLQAYVALASISGGSGQVRFTSLPFTSANVSNQFYSEDLSLQNSTFGAGVTIYWGNTQANATTAEINGTKAGTTNAQYAVTNLTNSSIFNLSTWYSTA